MRRANGTTRRPRHAHRDHVDPTRTRVPAVPPRPWGVVVPRLERGRAARVDSVRGPFMTRRLLHIAAAVSLTTPLLVLLGAAGAPGAAPLTAPAPGVSGPTRPYPTFAHGVLPPRLP